MTLIETTATAYRFKESSRDYPRVTSVLSLVRPDLREIPADVLHHAAERGKAVHRACWILAGGDASGLHWPSVHPEALPYVEAFVAFTKETGAVFLEKERLVVSQRYGYAGTMDVLAVIGGVCGIPDIKTCPEHAAHRLQVSAYLEAHNEQSGNKRKLKRWILYLKPTGRYRLVDCDAGSRHVTDFHMFTQILGVYRWLQAQNGGNTQ